MKIEKTIVVNFTENDKDALRAMYQLVTNSSMDCGLINTCSRCPFNGFCRIAHASANPEEFIRDIREVLAIAVEDSD